MENTAELQVQQPQEMQAPQPNAGMPVFADSEQFKLAQRQAQAMAAASIIPEAYRNSIPNCLIALEMAHRLRISPIMVMQNLYVVKGKPGWSGSFIIALLNSCGRFTPIRFKMTGKGASLACRAVAKDRTGGDDLIGTEITMDMVTAEGWGSKWKTMPEQMMQYRAAAFFGRVFAPDVIMGMQTVEEIEDVEGAAKEHVRNANENKPTINLP